MSGKTLIVTADDYGYTEGVSNGILDAHRNGIVTTTSAMMNFPSSQYDIARAKDECPDLAIGVHLVLTAGRPMLPAAQVRTLVDANGDFLRFDRSVGWQRRDAYQWMNNADVEQIHAEWTAQIEALIATGVPIDHLNSHHNISYLDERLLRTMMKLAVNYRIPVRHPPRNPLTEFATSQLRALGIDFPENDYILMMEDSSLPFLEKQLVEIDKGVTEIITHPARVDEELLAMSTYTHQRTAELATITSVEIRDTIDRLGFGLGTFSGVYN